MAIGGADEEAGGLLRCAGDEFCCLSEGFRHGHRAIGDGEAGGDAFLVDCLEALASIRTDSPDVVLFDIETHEGHWTDTLQQIKSSSPSPKLIILTNYTHPHVRSRCVDLGADFFFDKSTEFERVLDVLKELTVPRSEAA